MGSIGPTPGCRGPMHNGGLVLAHYTATSGSIALDSIGDRARDLNEYHRLHVGGSRLIQGPRFVHDFSRSIIDDGDLLGFRSRIEASPASQSRPTVGPIEGKGTPGAQQARDHPRSQQRILVLSGPRLMKSWS